MVRAQSVSLQDADDAGDDGGSRHRLVGTASGGPWHRAGPRDSFSQWMRCTTSLTHKYGMRMDLNDQLSPVFLFQRLNVAEALRGGLGRPKVTETPRESRQGDWRPVKSRIVCVHVCGRGRRLG